MADLNLIPFWDNLGAQLLGIAVKMVGEDDDYFKQLVAQLDSEEEDGTESERHNLMSTEAESEVTGPSSSKPMITSDFDKLALCTSDPTSSHAAVDLTSEIMGIDWDDIPDSLKANTMNQGIVSVEPDKTPMLPPMASTSIFTMTGTVEKMLDGKGEFRMYWIDALERAQTGTVYLFGRAQTGSSSSVSEEGSCCVAVTGLQRQVYFLPKRGVDLVAVSKDVQELCAKQRITPTA